MHTSREINLGIFVLIGLLCVAYLTVKLGKMEVLGGDGYSVEARFSSVSGLRVGASIEISGVTVGRVTGIGLDDKTSQAVVTLYVNKGIQLTDDTIASVKTSGLIGDKYVSLALGGSDLMLADGDEITDTESSVDLESLISKFAFGGV